MLLRCSLKERGTANGYNCTPDSGFLDINRTTVWLVFFPWSLPRLRHNRVGFQVAPILIRTRARSCVEPPLGFSFHISPLSVPGSSLANLPAPCCVLQFGVKRTDWMAARQVDHLAEARREGGGDVGEAEVRPRWPVRNPATNHRLLRHLSRTNLVNGSLRLDILNRSFSSLFVCLAWLLRPTAKPFNLV